MFSIDTYNNVAYGPLPGETMDIFIPRGASAPTGVEIFIHGGGYLGGSAKQGEPLWDGGNGQLKGLVDSFVTQNGVAYVSINYPLPVKVQSKPEFPQTLEAIESAIDFLTAHAWKYNINTSHIGLIGESAGAQIAAYVAETDARIDHFVDCFGPVDLSYDYDPKVKSLLSIEFGNDPSYRASVSPLNLVNSQATHKPAALIVQGLADVGLPPVVSEQYFHKLQLAGYATYWQPYQGGHSFTGLTAPAIKNIEAAIVGFALMRH